MSEQGLQILTPVGRLVMGDCFTPQTTDAEGNPLIIKNGANAGQPRVDYYMGLAIPKTDATFNPEVWDKINQVARQSFPNLFDASGTCISPKFAFKVIDGDSQLPNSKGNKPCDREGFPGHWILSFSGGFAPKCFTRGGASVLVPTLDAAGRVIDAPIRRGYYIRISGSVRGNGSQQQPGIFLNHAMVELVGYGEEIISGPDGAAVFGGNPAAALPAGASVIPLASATPLAATPAAALPTAPVASTPVVPIAPVAAAPAPMAPVAPAADFLTPVAAEPLYFDANGGGPFTAAQLTPAGYTPEMIAALRRA